MIEWQHLRNMSTSNYCKSRFLGQFISGGLRVYSTHALGDHTPLLPSLNNEF